MYLHCTTEETEYVNRIGRSALKLTYKEQLELLAQYKNGNKQALETLVQANYKFVLSIAKKYTHIEGIGLNDLIQEGLIGLMDGLEKFKPDLGFKFTTYVVNWIRMRINRAICNQSRTIRIPVGISANIFKVMRAYDDYFATYLTEPTAEQLAPMVNMAAKQVALILNLPKVVVSTDSPIEEDICLIDSIVEPKSIKPNFDFDKLTLQQTTIIKLRYGFFDETSWTVKQVAQKMQLLPEQISLLEEEALTQLKLSLLHQ